ncbi:MAG: adenosylcobinamide-phosphate synthase CbiB [Geminicoccaceae bacterium]
MLEPAAAVALALAVDAATGEPAWLYRRVPHPIVLIGRAIGSLERWLLRPAANAAAKRRSGIVLLLVVAGGAWFAGRALEGAFRALPLGWVLEALAMSTLLAQRSLVDHVRDVASGLERNLDAGRAAVARIVGRDPNALDRAGVSRAALESLAENLSDGVIAPLFWGLLLGLPGMLAYKAVNTLDSMVGHRSERYRDFGWASARFDDFVNYPAARLAGVLTVLAAGLRDPAAAERAWTAMRRDAPKHRSPNAGWPEAAFAGALGIRLAGPRHYAGVLVEDGWMGDGRADLGPDDIRAGLRLAWMTWAVALLLTTALALLR